MGKTLVFTVALASLTSLAGGLTDKISRTCHVTATNTFHGFARTCFTFRGYKAWVVEPSNPAPGARPWTWTMQWADAFVPRTPVLHLLRQGWHHVTIDTYRHRMDEQGLAVSRAFQEFLVKELGFSPKACLIGMSWGGFFSTRYAAANPTAVAAIYYDCPLLNFDGFVNKPLSRFKATVGPWKHSIPKDWSSDPRMPVNMAEAVAKAGIPVLLLYGGKDRVVPPAKNCDIFVPRFKAAGGVITVVNRPTYDHHPHGVDAADTSIADFFLKAVGGPAAK
jgi:pimeloyl-ACP methyl ester carboxylesterase